MVLNQSLGEQVKDSFVYIQTVNACHKRLKQWLARFHNVTTKNLHKYWGWFRWFEFNKRTDLSPTHFMKDMRCNAFQQFQRTWSSIMLILLLRSWGYD